MSFSAAASGTQKTLVIRPSQRFEGHTHLVRGVIHLLGGQRIMTCSSDGSLRVWNLNTGEQIGDPWRDEEFSVSAMALSLDGKKVVCGCGDGAVELWDIDTGKIIAKWIGNTNCVASVSWSRDCGRVVSVSLDGTARVWDAESGKTVLAIETGLSRVWTVIYSPDMTMIATGGNSEDLKEFIKIWDANTGKLITNLKGHTGEVICLAWTADGSTLISGSFDDSIRTWNTTTWQQMRVLTGHTGFVHGIAISPNGPILASASWDKTARLWNLENGLSIGLPLQHPHNVLCVSFSTDGKLLATGCWDSNADLENSNADSEDSYADSEDSSADSKDSYAYSEDSNADSKDNNAYSWDISGILEEAGLLNPTDGDKLLIDADATRRPGHKRRNVHRIPPRFFDDAPHHPYASRTHHLSSSARQYNITGNPSSHRRTHLGRLSSLFQRNTPDAPPRPSFLEWARSTSFHLPHRRDNEGIQLQAVDAPLAHGNYRNYSAREARKKREKEKEKARNARNAQKMQNTQNATNVSAGSLRPAQSSATQQSGGAAQAQAPSGVHPTVSTLSTTHAIAATPAATATVSLPDVVISRAGRWTRFWLFIGCVPAQYPDGHNQH